MAPKSSDATAKKATPAASKKPVSVDDSASDPATLAGGSSKPDQAVFNKEQDALKVQIDAAQAKLAAVRAKIDGLGKGGPGAQRRKELQGQLDEIRSAQGNVKANRSKIFEQIKALNESSQAKTKALNASKQKAPYKSVEDVDAHIRDLEKKIESGSLTLAGEKRAIADIQTAKRSRKAVEGFKAEQEFIDADRAKADALKKDLDDPENVAMSQKFDAIRAELDTLKAADDESYQNKNKLYDEMRDIKAQVDELWTKKKDAAKLHREANDRWYKKAAEDRARRQERYASERAAAELAKRKEIAERLREEATVPAFQAEIEDTQTLIAALSAKINGGAITAPSLNLANGKEDAKSAVGAKLELRQVEAAPTDLVARKKKGEEEENYFVAKKRKQPAPNGKAAAAAAPSPATNGESTPAADGKLNLPYSILSALLQLSIPPPTSTSDLPRTIDDLNTKKAWFEANQERVTKENVAKAEAEIKRLDAASAKATLPNDNAGEYPVEPIPTPAVPSSTSSPVDAAPVEQKLEEVKEAIEA